LQDKVLGLNFLGSLNYRLEGNDNLLDDTSNKNMCQSTSSEDEELMKISNRTRTGLKMHNFLKDKGKVDYIPYENEFDGDDDLPLSLRSIYKETFDC
jgi:hypothetical protein